MLGAFKGSLKVYLNKNSYNKYLHEENSPTVITSKGNKFWYYDGYLHREDGPAIEECEGKYKEYWYYGTRIKVNSDEEYLKFIKLKMFW